MRRNIVIGAALALVAPVIYGVIFSHIQANFGGSLTASSAVWDLLGCAAAAPLILIPLAPGYEDTIPKRFLRLSAGAVVVFVLSVIWVNPNFSFMGPGKGLRSEVVLWLFRALACSLATRIAVDNVMRLLGIRAWRPLFGATVKHSGSECS